MWYGHTTTRECVPSRRVCCSFNYNDRCCRKVPSRFLNTGRARSIGRLARRTGVLARRTGHSPVGAAQFPENFLGCVLNEVQPVLGVPGRWGQPPLPGQDPSNQPEPPAIPSPRPAPCGALLLVPCATGPDGSRCWGHAGVPSPPRSPFLLQLSLDRILRTSAHLCRGTCGAAHVQAVIYSPGKAPRREGTWGDRHHQAPPGQSRRSRLPGRGLASSRQLRAFRRQFALD